MNVIETDRLLLRPVELDDLDACATFLADQVATRLLHFPDPHAREEAEELLDRTIARAAGEVAMYTVCVRSSPAGSSR